MVPVGPGKALLVPSDAGYVDARAFGRLGLGESGVLSGLGQYEMVNVYALFGVIQRALGIVDRRDGCAELVLAYAIDGGHCSGCVLGGFVFA